MLSACAGNGEPDALVGNGWKLEWHDEFDGDSIDTTVWTHETNCWGGGNNELQCYTDRPENSFLRDGSLVIRALDEEFTGPAEPLEWEGTDPNVTATLPHTSARLVTRDAVDIQYGRIEVRAKVPGGQGAWPAIWMLPTDSVYGGWAASGEIDIMEAVNLGMTDQMEVHGTLHYGAEWPRNAYSGGSYTHEGFDPTADFHTYAIEWAAGEIRWYVDDVHYQTQTQAGWYSQSVGAGGELSDLTDGQPFDQPFHLIMNVAVGGAWPGPPNADTEFPLEMEVDHVRVYSCPETPDSLEACGTVSDSATLVRGNQPPEPVQTGFDPSFMEEDIVTVFDDEVIEPYVALYWSSSGSVDIQIVPDGDREAVVQFTFNTNDAVAYFQSADGFDFSDFRAVEFDLKVAVDPYGGVPIFMKTDCFHPCSTNNVPITAPPLGEWASYSVLLDDLVAHEFSALDVTTINTPLVVLPQTGQQNGVVIMVDNVRVVR